MRKFLFFTALFLFPYFSSHAQFDRFLIGVWSHSHDDATSSYHVGISTNVGNILQQKPELLVFPNPADDFICIEFVGEATISSVSLFNVQGRFVASSRISPLSTSSIPAGMYLLHVVDSNGVLYRHKVIKK
ncbi:MAG: T9SS type A sorting domain-containing protein [Bacteroidales bacterium]|nr:T9SS type A sorting domain-containing protein [Bacteroidales bacterium]MDY6348608.1 T9SS type A sorting domain-containing protein [Bacteroidales bacterium]